MWGKVNIWAGFLRVNVTSCKRTPRVLLSRVSSYIRSHLADRKYKRILVFYGLGSPRLEEIWWTTNSNAKQSYDCREISAQKSARWITCNITLTRHISTQLQHGSVKLLVSRSTYVHIGCRLLVAHFDILSVVFVLPVDIRYKYYVNPYRAWFYASSW